MENCQNEMQNYFLQTEVTKKNINKSDDEQKNRQYLYTQQIQSNNQKLLDFISDKKKLNLKSFFDRKGSEEFLSKKNEAMERIELNETIEDKNINEGEIKIIMENLEEKKKTKNKISKKRTEIVRKVKNRKFSVESYKNQNKKIRSSKNMNEFHFIQAKEKKYDEDSTNINIAQKGTREFTSNRKIINNKKLKEKNKNYKNQQNLSQERKSSIDTISTVNSKLFNDKRDYEHYKRFYIKEDDFFIEEIVAELRSKKNSLYK